ncbi:hypothetical protein FY041_27260 [Pseudomonas monteilii]|nr:hypothetical protein FY041_27260 [Pseudomonas monteilii]QIG26464.1 hypothetical protein FY043_27255 [Pseudomonas monteilii]
MPEHEVEQEQGSTEQQRGRLDERQHGSLGGEGGLWVVIEQVCRASNESLYRPLRGLARSHRYCAGFESGAIPVGAGEPAKRPANPTPIYRS